MTPGPVPAQVRRAIADAEQTLAAAGVASPRHDAEELASYVAGCPRSGLAIFGALSADQHAVYRRLVARRASRVPLQHLTGSAGFRYLDLAVGPGVFVPRPETEVVAGWCVDALREALPQTPAPVVVDLCTGSGAIALAIACEVPETRVHAVEREPAALEWARRNVAGTRAGGRVELHHADARDALHDLDGCVDLVVSNPPYLAASDRLSFEPEVRDHEPDAALWGGRDGLDGPKMIESVARRLLRAGGLAAVEHADDQGPAVAALFAGAEWADVVVRQDLAGRDRFVTARRREVAEGAGLRLL